MYLLELKWVQQKGEHPTTSTAHERRKDTAMKKTTLNRAEAFKALGWAKTRATKKTMNALMELTGNDTEKAWTAKQILFSHDNNETKGLYDKASKADRNLLHFALIEAFGEDRVPMGVAQQTADDINAELTMTSIELGEDAEGRIEAKVNWKAAGMQDAEAAARFAAELGRAVAAAQSFGWNGCKAIY